MTVVKSVLEFGWDELIQMDGSLLVAIREELSLSPEEMAAKLHCHSSTLNRYENERIRIPVVVIQHAKVLLDEARAARDGRQPASSQVEPPVIAASQAPVSPPPASGGAMAPPGYSDWVELVPARELPFWMPPLFVGIPVEPPSPPGTQARPAPLVVSGSVPSEPAATAPAIADSRPVLARPKALGRHQRVERWAAAACLAMVFNASSGASPGQNPRGLLQGQAPSLWTGVAGRAKPSGAASEKSLPPFKGQKHGPCAPEQGEFEADNRCWWRLDPSAPCPLDGPVKYEGMCLVPIPEPIRTPVADNSQGATHAAR